MSYKLEYSFITKIEDFNAEVSLRWDKAVLNSPQKNPFFLSDFIISWWKYFSEGKKLLIFMVSSGKEIIGGIPLVLSQGKARQSYARVISYLGGHAANYTVPLYLNPQVKVFALLKEALSSRRDWDVLHLPDIKHDSLLLSEYRDQEKNTDLFFSYLVDDHMNWAVDLSEGKDKFLSGISADLKKDLRAKRKHLKNKYGKIWLNRISSETDLTRYFNLYVDFSLNAFEGRKRSSNFRDRRYEDFFKEFLLRMAKRGWLNCHVMLAGEEVLAISFGYRFDKGYDWVLTGFNYKYKYFRPGYILVEELINEIAACKETYFNWYGDERLLKKQWCNKIEPLYQLFLIRFSPRGLGFAAINKTETILRSQKMALNFIRKIRNRFHARKAS